MLFIRSGSRLLVGLLTVAVVLTGLLASPAQARADRMSMAGIGTAVVPTDGAATFDGTLNGSPLSGPFTGTLTPADGTLPTVGSCEDAAARLQVTDERGRFVELNAAAGKVCAVWLPLGIMQAFDGQFTVAATSERRLRRVVGAMQVRLLGDQSDVYAVGG